MHTKKERGMTLIEILVAMVISGLVISALYSLFQTHLRIAIKQEETTLMQQELLSATAQIADELRMCGYSAQGAKGFGFAHMPDTGSPNYGRATNETAIYCSLDWNGDGVINENGTGSLREHVGYRLNVSNNGSPKSDPDNVLRKYDTGTVHWQPINTNIGDLSFTYFNAADNVINDPNANMESIRSVRVEITAIPSPSRSGLGIGNRTMSTTVWCRNTEMEKIP